MKLKMKIDWHKVGKAALLPKKERGEFIVEAAETEAARVIRRARERLKGRG